MVLLKTMLVGVTLLVAAILLLTVAGPYVTDQIQMVQRHDVEPHAQFLVGDVIDRQYSIPGNVAVIGTLDVAQAPTNQSSDIQFIVLDAQNYQLWAGGQQPNSFMFNSHQQGQSNFTFNTPSSGVYHFVFDNRASVYKKFVTLSVSYNEVSISNRPDPRIPYIAWGLLAVGFAVLIYGLARKPPIPWA
jgi:hypothetical protein